MLPEKLFDSTVVRMVGTLNIFCRLGQKDDVVEEGLPVDVANAEDHLGLKVDEDEG
jgi:hypothetical protein